MGPWVAGCDICQDVCPWNQQPLESSRDPDLQPRPWLLELKGERALQWDDATWDGRLRASALRRIKPWMWRRNIAAALRATQGVGQPEQPIDQPIDPQVDRQIRGNP